MNRSSLLALALVGMLSTSATALGQTELCTPIFDVTAQGLMQRFQLRLEFQADETPATSLETGTVLVPAIQVPVTIIRSVPEQQTRTLTIAGRMITFTTTVLRRVAQTVIITLPGAEGQWVAIDFCHLALFTINDTTPSGSVRAFGVVGNGQLSGVALYLNVGQLSGLYLLHGEAAEEVPMSAN